MAQVQDVRDCYSVCKDKNFNPIAQQAGQFEISFTGRVMNRSSKLHLEFVQIPNPKFEVYQTCLIWKVWGYMYDTQHLVRLCEHMVRNKIKVERLFYKYVNLQ